MNLQNAIIYDVEIFPNCFTLSMVALNSELEAVWEISEFRDDRHELMTWFNYLSQTQTPMIGFNNEYFDYAIVHFIFNNPHATPRMIYDFGMTLINSENRFENMIWPDNRFAPQIDLFKIYHFDNKAKSTNLKALQINMRSPNVVDMPVQFGAILNKEQIENLVIPYNLHDCRETKKFAHVSKDALDFRLSLIPQFGVAVMNWADTKIGSRMMESRLGQEICYDFSSGRKKTRQTTRTRIALNDIIFPYVRFDHPEFNRILDYLRRCILTTPEIQSFNEDAPKIKLKGVFTNLKAHVGGLDFYFGTGGIHGSVAATRIASNDQYGIKDIDVTGLYPSIAIVNRLAPAHLGEHFSQIYSQLPKERKEWQTKKGKKCVEANILKLASNGVYGNSNNSYSVFYDPQFMITITINGQLMLCMLAERLATVPTLQLIQINTDGITYLIQRDYEPHAAAICAEWETLTALVLEHAEYSRVWIRDVNNYVAESPDGSLKTKGAYWFPDPLDYAGSISNAQPPAWHKDLSNTVSIRAAVSAMVHGVDPETFIRLTTNPYDFMLRVKVRRSDKLLWGNQEVQRNTRYFISPHGEPLIKIAPPSGEAGTFKRAQGVPEAEYDRVMRENGGQWDASVCTKNRSVHEPRLSQIEAGHKVIVCNDIKNFDFSKIDYGYYINEARKLII